MKSKTILTAFAILVLLTTSVQAHEGRRFDIVIVDGQLAAQGYLSGADPQDDGGGITRPYFNAIHGHFDSNIGNTFFATLPGFDLPADTAAFLNGANLELELLSASKWETPILGATPSLMELDADEVIGVGFDTQASIDSNDLGSFTLASDITGSILDIDLAYAIDNDPADTLYALEWRLSTSQSGIADSGSVYTILSPPGSGPEERLHHQSLALERALGTTAVPEPNSVLILAIAGSLGLIKRRKR